MKKMKTNEYFKALYPDELVTRYRKGERDFEGINLLRAELEAIVGLTVVPFDTWHVAHSPNPQETPRAFCPLWADHNDVERRFEWDVNGRFCPSQLDGLPETKVLAGIDLSGINLSYAYLYPVDLAGADLTGANLKRSMIVDGQLSGVNLSRSDLRDATLPRADLTDANFYMARIDRCALNRVILKRARLIRAKLRKATLAGADLTGASIKHARFEGASLFGACLNDVDLSECDFSTCCVGELRISPSQRDQFLRALRIAWQ